MDAKQVLRDGIAILDRAMRPAGFKFEEVRAGEYPCGRYWRRGRVLEFHVSSSLGLVSQRMGELAVMHDDWMRALLGPKGGEYPRHSPDPLEGFPALAKDPARPRPPQSLPRAAQGPGPPLRRLPARRRRALAHDRRARPSGPAQVHDDA